MGWTVDKPASQHFCEGDGNPRKCRRLITGDRPRHETKLHWRYLVAVFRGTDSVFKSFMP